MSNAKVPLYSKMKFYLDSYEIIKLKPLFTKLYQVFILQIEISVSCPFAAVIASASLRCVSELQHFLQSFSAGFFFQLCKTRRRMQQDRQFSGHASDFQLNLSLGFDLFVPDHKPSFLFSGFSPALWLIVLQECKYSF